MSQRSRHARKAFAVESALNNSGAFVGSREGKNAVWVGACCCLELAGGRSCCNSIFVYVHGAAEGNLLARIRRSFFWQCISQKCLFGDFSFFLCERFFSISSLLENGNRFRPGIDYVKTGAIGGWAIGT